MLLLVLLTVLGTCTAGTIYDCPTCLKMRVGKAEYVTGPVGAPLDNPFWTMSTSSGFFGYSANGDTNIIIKGSLNRTLSQFTVALQGGVSGNFDECGSWLNSAINDGTGVIRAWYHAESKCNYDIGQTYKSVAYAESKDGGQTFTKLNYPYNQVITGPNPPAAGITVGNGDQAVVDGGDGFYYMFFINWDNYGHCVARAAKSSGGRPGSWLKYYQGKYQNTGLGGTCSLVSNLIASTVYKHTSGNYVSVASGTGVTLAFGADPVTWKLLNEPLLFTEQSQWTRTSTSTELIGYPALVTMDGVSSILSQNFYLYYTYLPPGLGFASRYLVRRSVTFTLQNTTDGLPQGGVELSRYTNGSVWWSTTTLPLGATFKYDKALGFLLTTQYSNTVPLYDCYIPLWNSYMATNAQSDCTPANGITYLRQMGYMYQYKPTQTPTTLPLYRCYNNKTQKHTLSNSPQCDGNGTLEFIMGYVMAN